MTAACKRAVAHMYVELKLIQFCFAFFVFVLKFLFSRFTLSFVFNIFSFRFQFSPTKITQGTV